MPLPSLNLKCSDKCTNPMCGSTEKITDEYIKQLVDGHYLPAKYLENFSFMLQVPLMDVLTSKVNLEGLVPMLSIALAVCAKCYTVYCTGVSAIPINMTPMGGQAGPPGLGGLGGPPGKFPFPGHPGGRQN